MATSEDGAAPDTDCKVVHVPSGNCEPVVVELEDEFGELREVYLDYETANAFACQLTESIPDGWCGQA